MSFSKQMKPVWLGVSTAVWLSLSFTACWAENPPLRARDEGAQLAGVVFDVDCVGAGISCAKASSTRMTMTVAGAASSNSFETLSVPAGTNPVADSATDTLTLTETSFLTITGTASSDTIDITQVTTDLGTDGLIAANAVALTTDTTGNYVASVADGSGIDVTGTAAEGWTATVNLLYTDTLAADPSMNAEEARFSTDGTGGGLLFEGLTADTIEGLLAWSPTTSDRTLTLPDATDTLVGRATTDTLTNKTLAAADNVIAADTAVALAANGANCAAGSFPLGVDDTGASESCTSAGGTAFFVGSFTRDTTVASGTQAVTGVGFQPRAVIFFAAQSSADEASWGLSDSTTDVGNGDQNGITAGTYNLETSLVSINDVEASGTLYQGEITTLGADGFTITWTRTGTPSGTLTTIYMAFD